jgi:GGDEF domain-containing protein
LVGDRVAEYLGRAEGRLPGVLYSFNIADFKRRNGHLGHVAGDADVAELGSTLAALEPRVVVARVRGERWLLLAPDGAEQASSRREVEAVLAAFAREEPLVVGWEVHGVKDGLPRVGREVVASRIRRGVRCLYAHVRTRADLEAAVARIEENDYALPVDRPIALEDVETIARQPWRCVEEYPKRPPSCPFCDTREVEWVDGDGSVYGGDGACKGCGASLSFRDVHALVAKPW